MRAICFDLDGTLLHLDEGIAAALTAAFESVAGECRDDWLEAYDAGFFERFHDCEPEPYRHGVERARAETDFDGGVAETREALLAAEIDALSPTPDAAATLESLREEYLVGVVTNGHPEWQRAKLDAHGLTDHVDAVVASYEVGHHKPHPAPFDLAEDRLDADAYGMVGDSEADTDGAANAGWDAVRFEGGAFGDVPAALAWR